MKVASGMHCHRLQCTNPSSWHNRSVGLMMQPCFIEAWVGCPARKKQAPEAVAEGDGADYAAALHATVYHRLPGSSLPKCPARGTWLILMLQCKGRQLVGSRAGSLLPALQATFWSLGIAGLTYPDCMLTSLCARLALFEASVHTTDWMSTLKLFPG